MLSNRTFHKITRKGGVVKVVKEHYLRDDISCGVAECASCQRFPVANPLVLKELCAEQNSLCRNRHLLVLDTNVILHQMDLLEEIGFNNVIVCQTVVNEVKHQNASLYKRLVDLLTSPQGVNCTDDTGNDSRRSRYYLFGNEFHKDTYVERMPGESANDYNDRAIRTVVGFYQNHISDDQVDVVLLTNDLENKRRATEERLKSFTVGEYVRGIVEISPVILDKLVQSENIEEEMAGAKIGRKGVLFPEHLSLAEVTARLKDGRLKQGPIQISRDNYLEATVSVDGSDEPVFIQGLLNLNRAVHNDVVAVEMLPEAEWSYPAALLKIQSVTDTSAVDEVDSDEDEIVGTLEDAELKAVVNSRKRKASTLKAVPTGKVVGIIKRNWRPYCGVLLKSPRNDSTRHLFTPAERRIPRIRIETRQSEFLCGQRIIVSIDSWPRSSRYPHGHFVKALGTVGDKTTENEVLLLEHDVPHHSFSQAVLDCLPKTPYSIPESVVKNREDFREFDVCSVDPPGCTDIDDALHCRELPNGNLEVGVHIADVSHYLKSNTAMDKEASERGTTVYLVDKRIDMLPNLLSGNICSLRGGEERLVFSAIWQMTPEADVLNVRFTKGIIKNKAAMTYAEAQAILDDPSRTDGVSLGLRRLNCLAKKLRAQRQAAGALTLASMEVRFQIDSETADPIDVESKQMLETNSMVEEFMLLANISVAKRILEEFPDSACLRRHPVPPPSFYKPIVELAASRGFTLACDSGKALAESLERAVLPGNPFFNTMLRILTCRCMTQAVYFSSGTCERSEYVHFGLASPIYTHFTSPIRRYADVIVHRMLAAAIGADSTEPELLDRAKVERICANLNYRHKQAQYAGRASVLLNTHIFFKNRCEQLDGYILSVKKNALQILIPKYGLESSLLVPKDGPLEFDADENTFLCPKSGIVLRTFDRVKVQVSVNAADIQHQKLQLKLLEPQIVGLSIDPLFDIPQTENESPPVKKLKMDTSLL